MNKGRIPALSGTVMGRPPGSVCEVSRIPSYLPLGLMDPFGSADDISDGMGYNGRGEVGKRQSCCDNLQQDWEEVLLQYNWFEMKGLKFTHSLAFRDKM